MATYTDTDEAAFERALFASIDLSPIATVITNPRLPDNPIVAANHAFCALTGFDARDVVGHNCRFLARVGDESPQRAQLRDAIANARALLVELRNYRKDGTPFRNAVMIAPVLLADGAVGYFIGSQMEVVAADATAQAARQIAALSRRQREVLQGLLAGERNKQIGFRLGINEKTVKMHRAALMRKLGARSTGDAIRIGVTAGLADR